MNGKHLFKALMKSILVVIASSLIVITSTLSLVAHAEQPDQPTTLIALKTSVPETEWFLLTYPVASKRASSQAEDVIYTSIVDHTPPFYCTSGDNILQPYTGELANTSGCYQDGTTPTLREYSYDGHSGLDIALSPNTPIYAAHAASVHEVRSVDNGGYGKYVVLRDKENTQFYTLYAHLTSTAVNQDSYVARGQLIGYSGNTGASTGPHLHFGLYYNRRSDTSGTVLDPYGWFSTRTNHIGASITDNKWASGFPSDAPAPFDLNDGTVIGNELIHVDRSRNGTHRIGRAPTSDGVHAIEHWYVTDNYGSAGAPVTAVYLDEKTGNDCQEFEGGTYCTTPTYTYPFTDVPLSHWAHRYVGWANREGVVSGYGDGTFRPDDKVTRGQSCKIIVLGLDIDIDTSGGPHFTDVPLMNVFYQYIETAYNTGIISGYNTSPPCDSYFPPPCFRWGNDVSRTQMAKIVANAGIEKGWLRDDDDEHGPDYADVPSTNPFYHFIEILYNSGVIQYRRERDGGGNGGRFGINYVATRGEAAQFIHELIYAVSPPPTATPSTRP
jgi:hypothetical protein